MDRYNPSRSGRMNKHLAGKYVTFDDAAGAVELAIKSIEQVLEFVKAHEEDIENDINDFGELKPMLDMVNGTNKSH